MARASRDLRAVPGVSDVSGHIGRAVTGDQVVDVNSSELWVRVASDADYDATTDIDRQRAEELPGAQPRRADLREAEDPGRRRGGRQAGRGAGARQLRSGCADGSRPRPLVVRVYGENLTVLRRQAATDEAADLAGRRRRGSASRDDRQPADGGHQGEPRQRPALRRQAGRRAPQGGHAALRHPGRQRVRGSRRCSTSSCAPSPTCAAASPTFAGLLLDIPGGGYVRLGQVADVRVRSTPGVIQREASQRRMDVSANVSGRSAGDVEERRPRPHQGQTGSRSSTTRRQSGPQPATRPRSPACSASGSSP